MGIRSALLITPFLVAMVAFNFASCDDIDTRSRRMAVRAGRASSTRVVVYNGPHVNAATVKRGSVGGVSRYPRYLSEEDAPLTEEATPPPPVLRWQGRRLGPHMHHGHGRGHYHGGRVYGGAVYGGAVYGTGSTYYGTGSTYGSGGAYYGGGGAYYGGGGAYYGGGGAYYGGRSVYRPHHHHHHHVSPYNYHDGGHHHGHRRYY